ncbi:MAG: polysaccharide biosynthesis/export family protein [Rubrimonas sp.]
MSAHLRAIPAACLAVLLALGPARAESPYRLGPGDVVSVYVDGELSLRARLEVDEAGTIPVDMIGFAPVAGLTAEEASARLAERLVALEVGAEPQVAVVIEERRPFFAHGAVAAPGPYPHRPGLTVARALAVAGGLDIADVGGSRRIDRMQLLDMQGRLLAARRTVLASDAALARIDAFFAEDPVDFFEAAATDLLLEAPGAEAFVAAERDRLAGALGAIADRRREVADRLEAMEEQLGKIAQRRSEIQKLYDGLAEQVDDYKRLRDRGLGTMANLAAAQRDMSSSRADLLQTDQAFFYVESEKRRLAGFVQDFVNEMGNAMRSERLRALAEREDARTMRALLGDQLAALGVDLDDETGEPSYRAIIDRVGPGGAVAFEADAATAVLPGDVLRIVARALPGGGAP